MSFLKKLRDRMFRSSDKIGEGLDSLVGGDSPGLVGRLLGADAPRRLVDDALLQGLEDLLIESDMGVDTAMRVTANIAEGRFGKRVTTGEIKTALSDEISR
ncbi:signal recognition particle receptor subunit alpha, partial [Bacillus cereus]|nr:signal recognition particle receptor subunit alpha [Bacillus cereus]